MRDQPMVIPVSVLLLVAFIAGASGRCSAQASAARDDSAQELVRRLDLNRYKSTIKSLTQFGDRQQGTDRNREALNWIEARLKKDGCTPLRLRYDMITPPRPVPRTGSAPHLIAGDQVEHGVGGSRIRGAMSSTTGPGPEAADTSAQPDPRLRTLNAQTPQPGAREDIYCTKTGASHPNEMYLLGAHMDGRGLGEAADDDASGTALVMELARIFSSADVQTDRSIRFVLWNNEETGLDGSAAYVAQRAPLQGKEEPTGSGRYPEPKWLGMIQHDMLLWDHGMPRADGSFNPDQRPEADVNIEFQATATRGEEAMKLAFLFRDANEKYATDYPAAVGDHMSNTDSSPFMNLIPAISVRENERGMHIGAGWNPHYHQPTDNYASYSDNDFRLGLNAAQTTLGAVAGLAGTTIVKIR